MKNLHPVSRIFFLLFGQTKLTANIREAHPVTKCNLFYVGLSLGPFYFWFITLIRFATFTRGLELLFDPGPRNQPGASQNTAINWRLKDLWSPPPAPPFSPLSFDKVILLQTLLFTAVLFCRYRYLSNNSKQNKNSLNGAGWFLSHKYILSFVFLNRSIVIFCIFDCVQIIRNRGAQNRDSGDWVFV